MLQLFFAPHTCALASHIALIDAGVEYKLERVDFELAEQSREVFLKVNPKGRVPALVTSRGVLTESPAMLMYIAQTNPSAVLAPLDDAFELAQLQAFNSYLCSTLHVAHAHRMRGHRWADDPGAIEAMRKKVPHTVTASFEHIQRFELRGPFVMGERYSIADPYLFTFAQWMEADGVDLDAVPDIVAHRELMHARPSVQRALDEELGPR